GHTNSIALSAASAKLFPSLVGLSGDVSNVSGSFVVTGANAGALDLDAGALTMRIGKPDPALEMTASDLKFHFNTDVAPAPNETFLSGHAATLKFPRLTLPDDSDRALSLEVQDFVLRRDGFSVGAAGVSNLHIRLGSVADLVGLALTFHGVSASIP